jgi:hypothetical protein
MVFHFAGTCGRFHFFILKFFFNSLICCYLLFKMTIFKTTLEREKLLYSCSDILHKHNCNHKPFFHLLLFAYNNMKCITTQQKLQLYLRNIKKIIHSFIFFFSLCLFMLSKSIFFHILHTSAFTWVYIAMNNEHEKKDI